MKKNKKSNSPAREEDSNSASGFTLIEVMIAMMILTGAIVTLSTAWSGNYRRLHTAKIKYEVAQLLQRVVTEFEVENRGKTLEEIKDNYKGTFEDYPKHRWTIETKEFEMPDLTPLLVGEDGGANEQMISMIKQMTEYISKSVKEVLVTVHLKYKKREIKYSLTTYFVDYSKDLPLGAGGAVGGGGGQ